jgi:hypothetical protein
MDDYNDGNTSVVQHTAPGTCYAGRLDAYLPASASAVNTEAVHHRYEQGAPRRAGVRMDRYAERQIRRHYKLTGKAMQVLHSMTLDADWRDGCWTGTQAELHEDIGMSRNTVPKAVDELVVKGLAVEIQPFRQGAHSPGIFLLPLYETMVMLSKGRVQSRSSARFPTDSNALQSRRKRAPIAQFCAFAAF